MENETKDWSFSITIVTQPNTSRLSFNGCCWYGHFQSHGRAFLHQLWSFHIHYIQGVTSEDILNSRFLKWECERTWSSSKSYAWRPKIKKKSSNKNRVDKVIFCCLQRLLFKWDILALIFFTYKSHFSPLFFEPLFGTLKTTLFTRLLTFLEHVNETP